MNAMKPTEIAEYIRTEFTPYASMDEDEGKAHLARLIQDYAEEFARNEIKDFNEELLKSILDGRDSILKSILDKPQL